jgi:membrane protein YqaA with SNARE-associated domain
MRKCSQQHNLNIDAKHVAPTFGSALLAPLTGFVQLAERHLRGFEVVLRHLGGFGLLVLAIIDSSPIPTFGGLDILIAILAARHREPWYYYAGFATAGSVVGAYLTYRMARHAGLDYLHRKFGKRKVSKLLAFFHQWGTGALVVSTVLPFPFPTSAFFAIAGALDYPLRTFLVVVVLGRAVRYATIAAIASHYRRRFVVGLRHVVLHPGWSLAIVAAVVIAITAAMVLRKRLQSARPAVKSHAT